MAERLEAAEGALMALAQEDIMVALVHAKLALAQKDWDVTKQGVSCQMAMMLHCTPGSVKCVLYRKVKV